MTRVELYSYMDSACRFAICLRMEAPNFVFPDDREQSFFLVETENRV